MNKVREIQLGELSLIEKLLLLFVVNMIKIL